MFRRLVALSVVFALAACASQIMQGYVGKPLTETVLDYGPPVAAYDMDNETRAFVWVRAKTFTSPGYASTTGSSRGTGTASVVGNTVAAHGTSFYDATTYYQPPRTSTWSCNYVLLAKRNGNGIEGPGAWTVTGFRSPQLRCE